MKLKKFKKEESNKKNIFKIIGAFVVVGILFLAGISYAVYQRETEVTFINARVGDFGVYLDNFRVSSVTSNAITLEYNVFEFYDLNTTVTCKYGTSSGNYTNTASKVSNEKCEITGLTKNTVYHFQVCVKNNLNQEECNDGVEMTTYDAPTLSNITASSTYDTIDLNYVASGEMFDTTCKYGTSNGIYTTNGKIQTSTKCSLTGLTKNTMYYYQVCATNNGGSSCKTGSIKTLSMFADFVNVGDYISMTPTATSYTISSDLTGYTSDQEINPSELNLWKVIKKNEDGTVEMVSNYVSSARVFFKGATGYMNLVGGLNTIAAQYTDGKHVQSTRHMGYSNQIETCTTLIPSNCPNDTGYLEDTNLVQSSSASLFGFVIGTSRPGNYWLASRNYFSDAYKAHYVTTAGNASSTPSLYTSGSSSSEGQISNAIRPIITLSSSTLILSGNGTKASPYVLE